MKHCKRVSQMPARAITAGSPLEIKLVGIIEIVDRLLMAQRQSAWKAPFPADFESNTTTTTTTGGGTLPTVL